MLTKPKTSEGPNKAFQFDSRKFIVFSGMKYYPYGGWSDYRGDFCSLQDALLYLKMNIDPDEREWFQVVDIETKEVVKEND